MRAALVAAVVMIGAVACSERVRPMCWTRCEDGCASDEACSSGYCAPAGATCEPTFERVAAGTGFACALDQLGRLWCWGDNLHFQVSPSETRQFPRAVVVGDDRWDGVSAGGGHACALRDGELWCWGRNDRHQVTPGASDIARPQRIELAAATRWTAVATGLDYTCAIGNGRLFCWGAGDSGKLGNGGAEDKSQPTAVQTAIGDWVAVAAGGRHTCALSRSFGMFCWGEGARGQLGNAGAAPFQPEPIAVQLQDVVSFSVGLAHSCAVTRGGQLFCWGASSGGELGDPTVVLPNEGDRVIPTLASSRRDWAQVSSAERYSCARRLDEVWCWGATVRGGLGTGVWETSRTFQRVLTGATDVSVAWNGTSTDPAHDEGDADLSCAVVHGAAQCWGDNRSGQLGQGNATSAAFPVEIAGAKQWTHLVVGGGHACGISDADAYCWGSNEAGQVDGQAAGRTAPCVPGRPCDVGVPAQVSTGETHALSVGRAHTCALRDGQVTCWGDNSSGQCGLAASPAPVMPIWLDGLWTSMYQSGADGTCAVTAAQTTHCWGDAIGMHEPAHEPLLDGARAVALGTDYGCMLDDTNALGCFGNPAGGVFGNGTPGRCGDGRCNDGETAASCPVDCGDTPITQLDRVYTAIDVSWTKRFACGLRADKRVDCWGENTRGQTGLAGENGAVVSPVTVPYTHETLAKCSKISVGGGHACAICDGEIMCWGDARHGELGDGLVTPVAQPRPRPVVGYTLADNDAWHDLSAGDTFTCARTQLGRGLCWGTNAHGALGNGGTSSALPVVVTRAY
ncbi:MAG: hypothetical protein KIT31_35810 [Deltaproteobacteria bacterium]|nr:hypothetical protein [Deltaproteobacteria bacterium]